MSRESTIRDLRAKARQLESKKRDIDKQVEAIYTTMRVFEQNGEVPRDGVSSYAKELTATIYDILKDERPLHRDIILARVQERGIFVGGQKPVNSIGSYLSTDARFGNVARGIWTLAEEPQSDISAEIDNSGHLLLEREPGATALSGRLGAEGPSIVNQRDQSRPLDS